MLRGKINEYYWDLFCFFYFHHHHYYDVLIFFCPWSDFTFFSFFSNFSISLCFPHCLCLHFHSLHFPIIFTLVLFFRFHCLFFLLISALNIILFFSILIIFYCTFFFFFLPSSFWNFITWNFSFWFRSIASYLFST